MKTTSSEQNPRSRWPLELSEWIQNKQEWQKQAEAGKKKNVCKQTSHRWIIITLQNMVLHRHGQKDVDKLKEKRQWWISREREREWVHHDRWTWVPSNLQSCCNMTKITLGSVIQGVYVLVGFAHVRFITVNWDYSEYKMCSKIRNWMKKYCGGDILGVQPECLWKLRER